MYFKGDYYKRISLTFRHVLIEGTKKSLYGEKNYTKKKKKKIL